VELELGASSLAELQAKIRMDTLNYNQKLSNVPERDVDVEEKMKSNSRFISPKINTNITLQTQINHTINNM
jgi:hypothetical protein